MAARTVFITGLGPEDTERLLFLALSEAAEIEIRSIRVCRDPDTRLSLGMAYINMYTEADAMLLAGLLVGGKIEAYRNIGVMVMQTKERHAAHTAVNVEDADGVFPTSVHLSEKFKKYGRVVFARVPRFEDGATRGYGIVHFAQREGAERAARESGHKINIMT